MKVPVSWLSTFCDPGLSADRLAERLAMSGTEVERVVSVGATGSDGNRGLFRVGIVRSVDKHPDADRLSVCEVDTGDSEPRTIVCGASNVAPGIAVAVALPGAVLPGGVRLKRATLRGVASEGMILSEEELGLVRQSAGIMVLDCDGPAGQDLDAVVPIGDEVLEVEITPNRPDCLGVYGVAREVHAVTRAPLAPDPTAADAGEALGAGSVGDYIEVAVECPPELCPRFTARVFGDVRVGESPAWMKARLMAAGQRPINNVVDITNYVMLETGQPMHAYDLDRVPGGKLVVRTAREGETLQTLDGVVRAFDSDAVIVCDDDGPSGIAGIMGGSASEVSGPTVRVVLEAANWDATNIHRTSSKLALRTEASGRFEKQLHPDSAMGAQRLASRLMMDLAGAKLVPGTIDIYSLPPSPIAIELRSEAVNRLLGARIEEGEIAEILGLLGFSVERADGGFTVGVPGFRHFDVQRPADLIEEIARIHGIDSLPATLPALRGAVGGLTRIQSLRRRVEDGLRDRGLDEAITWSFLDGEFCDRLRLPASDARRRVLTIANPLSEDQSSMRTTLLPGLMAAAATNLAARAKSVRLFESGRVFFSLGQEELPRERHMVAALMAGDLSPKTWRSDARPCDFFAAKGILVALLQELGVNFSLVAGGPAFLHPGRGADVVCDSYEAGWIGEVHPEVARASGLDGPVVAFEVDVDRVLHRVPAIRSFEDVITYPAVYEDVAVVLDEEAEAQAVVDVVGAAGGEMLRDARIFDLYRGEQIGEGRKSLALRLEFRASDRTLTDAEVAGLRRSIEEALASELDATIRSSGSSGNSGNSGNSGSS